MAQVRGGYTEVETLDDVDGARAVISRRNGHTTHTVAFFKAYSQDGEKLKTAFFNLKHLASLERLIPVVRNRIAELEAAAGTGSVDRR